MIQASFRVLEHTAPSIGARWADRWWFTLPTSPVNYQNHPIYGFSWWGTQAYGTNSPFGVIGGYYYTRLGLTF